MLSDSSRDRLTTPVALVALGAMFLGGVAKSTHVDLDMWHEMGLIREALALGRLPLEDRFAYTPTVYPSVHHEWGTGAVSYFVAMGAGSAGLLVLKHLLTAGIAAGTVACSRRRGAGFPVLCVLLPIAIPLSLPGFSTIRAQMFTLLLLVCLLYFLDQDRRGKRWWIGPWLVLYLIWVNLHAGFVVGLGLFGLHTLEQLIRRQPVRHLILAAPAMVALIAINPYGIAYFSYLLHALPMDRPLVTEWRPLWEAPYPDLIVYLSLYLASLALIVYAVRRLGVGRMPGLILVIAAACEALLHVRHLPLYAVVWLCCAPAFIQATKLGDIVTRFWTRRRRAMLVLWGSVGILGAATFVMERPWRLRMPANPGEDYRFTYPVGAVIYLDEVGFQGNLMVPFMVGAFVTWELHPDVKVSIDSRAEVAYPPGALEEHIRFYAAEPGWRRTLDAHPTDAVLVPSAGRVAAVMVQAAGWSRIYRDDAYEVFARPGLILPPVDRRGNTFVGVFPYTVRYRSSAERAARAAAARGLDRTTAP